MNSNAGECLLLKIFHSIKWIPSQSLHFSKSLFAGTYYDTMEVNRSCSSKEIRSAFLKLSKKYHPDVNRSDPKNHDRFVALNEAYSVLSNPQLRHQYDMKLNRPKTVGQKSYSTPYDPFEVRDSYSYPRYPSPHNSGYKNAFTVKFVFFLLALSAFAGFLQIQIVRNKQGEENLENEDVTPSTSTIPITKPPLHGSFFFGWAFESARNRDYMRQKVGSSTYLSLRQQVISRSDTENARVLQEALERHREQRRKKEQERKY